MHAAKLLAVRIEADGVVPPEQLAHSLRQSMAGDFELPQNAVETNEQLRPADRRMNLGEGLLKVLHEIGFCRVKDFSPDNALIREAETLIKQGSHRSSKTRFWQKMP
jgi:hypothetical protein